MSSSFFSCFSFRLRTNLLRSASFCFVVCCRSVDLLSLEFYWSVSSYDLSAWTPSIFWMRPSSLRYSSRYCRKNHDETKSSIVAKIFDLLTYFGAKSPMSDHSEVFVDDKQIVGDEIKDHFGIWAVVISARLNFSSEWVFMILRVAEEKVESTILLSSMILS